MRTYFVYYVESGAIASIANAEMFPCEAEDEERAKQQCLDIYPAVRILSVSKIIMNLNPKVWREEREKQQRRKDKRQ